MHRRTVIGLGLAATALIVKAAILWQLHDHVLLQPDATPDSEAYFELAQRVIAGDWALGPGAYFVSPLYIYFLAGTYGLTGSLLAVKAIQIVFGAAAVWLVWWMTRAWFGDRAALFAGALAVLTGLCTFYEVSLLQASLDPFLTAAALAALTAALTGRHALWFSVSGMIFALQILNRPNVMVAVLGVIAVLAITRRLRAAGLVAAGAIVALLPIGARNLAVTGEWSLLPSHGGLNLYIGNAAEANGLYRSIPGIRGTINGQAADARRVAEAATDRSMTDADVSAYFTNLSVEWIRSQPGAWLRLMGTKLYYTLHGQHFAVPLSYPFFVHDTGSLLAALAVGPWLLVALGAYGLVAARRPPHLTIAAFSPWLIAAPALVVSVALFFVTERYRLPLLIPLLVGAGAALDRWAHHIGRRQWMPLAAGVAIVATGVVALNQTLPLIDADGRREERVKMAEALARAGDLAAAEDWLSKALDIYPYPEVAHLRIASILAAQSNVDAAVAHLRSAARVSFGADDPDTWLQAGRLAARLRAPDVAADLFRRAVSLAPTDTPARDQLAIALMLSGDLDAASTEFRMVVEADPANADAWAHLAYIAVQRGTPAEALDYARRALALAPAHELANRIVAVVTSGPRR